jgi:hypothetical protein
VCEQVGDAWKANEKQKQAKEKEYQREIEQLVYFWHFSGFYLYNICFLLRRPSWHNRLVLYAYFSDILRSSCAAYEYALKYKRRFKKNILATRICVERETR